MVVWLVDWLDGWSGLVGTLEAGDEWGWWGYRERLRACACGLRIGDLG